MVAGIDADAKFVVIVEFFPVPKSGLGFGPRTGCVGDFAEGVGVADAVQGRGRVR